MRDSLFYNGYKNQTKNHQLGDFIFQKYVKSHYKIGKQISGALGQCRLCGSSTVNNTTQTYKYLCKITGYSF